MSHYNRDKIPKKTRSDDLNCGNYAKQWENVKLICCFCRPDLSASFSNDANATSNTNNNSTVVVATVIRNWEFNLEIIWINQNLMCPLYGLLILLVICRFDLFLYFYMKMIMKQTTSKFYWLLLKFKYSESPRDMKKSPNFVWRYLGPKLLGWSQICLRFNMWPMSIFD